MSATRTKSHTVPLDHQASQKRELDVVAGLRRWRDELDRFMKDWNKPAGNREKWKDWREAFAQQWDTSNCCSYNITSTDDHYCLTKALSLKLPSYGRNCQLE